MNDDPFARAVQRVQAAEQAEQATKRNRRNERISSTSRSGFRIHASVYVATNLMLIMIWLATWLINGITGYPWFIYPLLGWGIGLAAHFAAVQHHLTRRPRSSQGDQPLPQAGGQGVAASATAGPARPESSTAEELTRLAELHRSGALSDEEFSAAKGKLLK
ncbi:MAG: 2TM domain-containing protein [Actinobacteria bacterium]|nr:2TM domain-containing protein [Actinomycetota bacterium]